MRVIWSGVATLLGIALCLQARAANDGLGDTIDLYARGEFARALANVEAARLDVRALTSGAQQWIDAGPAAASRSLVAAAFAVDVVWHLTRVERDADPWPLTSGSGDATGPDRPDTWARSGLSQIAAARPVVVWASAAVSGSSPPSDAERAFWLAAIGVLEDAETWRGLIAADGPLVRARRRIPDEPRFRLADVVARATIALLRPCPCPLTRADVLNDEHLQLAPRSETQAERFAREWAALAGDATIGADAEAQMGYLDLRRQRWAAALAHFDLARALTTEPFLHAATDYFSGWAYERLGRHERAISSYQRALASAPGTRNLATVLGAELFAAGRAREAAEVLDGVFARGNREVDLLTSFRRGDSRLVPDFIARMRAALR